MMTFHVDSEVGQLKQAIVHRPGLELSRLTPGNVDELLFDDVMWAQRAREEHDAFVAQLEARGVVVHHFARLLSEALDQSGAREFLQERLSFEPVIATPQGMTKVEVRIMYVWVDELLPVLTILRMGRGLMMGVDHNKNMEWVGASAALF